MAEGIAKSIAPAGVEVYSAGSSPATVHPLAVAAMAAEGVSLAGQASKGLSAVPLGEIDTVITLCAEEFCPELDAAVERLHWPLEDPAAAEGTDAERVLVFRRIGADLRQRIRALFGLGDAVGREDAVAR